MVIDSIRKLAAVIGLLQLTAAAVGMTTFVPAPRTPAPQFPAVFHSPPDAPVQLAMVCARLVPQTPKITAPMDATKKRAFFLRWWKRLIYGRSLIQFLPEVHRISVRGESLPCHWPAVNGTTAG